MSKLTGLRKCTGILYTMSQDAGNSANVHACILALNLQSMQNPYIFFLWDRHTLLVVQIW